MHWKTREHVFFGGYASLPSFISLPAAVDNAEVYMLLQVGSTHTVRRLPQKFKLSPRTEASLGVITQRTPHHKGRATLSTPFTQPLHRQPRVSIMAGAQTKALVKAAQVRSFIPPLDGEVELSSSFSLLSVLTPAPTPPTQTNRWPWKKVNTRRRTPLFRILASGGMCRTLFSSARGWQRKGWGARQR